MRFGRNLLTFAVVVMLLGAVAGQPAQGQDGDVLFIGDGGDNTVKRFDAATGAPLDGPTEPFVGGLAGPRGMLFDDGYLLVVSQNVDLGIPGEVLVFDGETGAEGQSLVAATYKYAPFAPRGMVFGIGGDLFVADLTTANGTSHGELLHYDANDGTLLGATRAKGLKNKEYHPRGVVLGPDGLLYVAVRSLKKDGLGGGVLRFLPDGTFWDVFVDDDGGVGQLNRPEGLVFGPDGLLYITSFRAAPGDTDAIRIYDGDGEFVRKIDLDDGSATRAYAQSLLFGPGGRLFVPINNTGEVRSYDVATDVFETFIPAGGQLLSPWYLTFKNTDPATLQYVED